MKILVVGMSDNMGGMESVIMNYVRNINSEQISFDFLTFHKKIAYEDELLEKGCGIYYVASKAKYFRHRKQMQNFFISSKGKYDAIWVNLCILHNLDCLTYAKKYGIPRRIIHSHNSENMSGFIRGVFHNYNRRRVGKYATDFWACSEGAADFFYKGKNREDALIVNNAIDIKSKSFDEIKRKNIREKLSWEDKMIVGNIGRLHFQKNQMFLIDIFHKLLEREPNARLVLVGKGEDEKKLKEYVKEYGIEDYVFFAGMQHDIQAWLSSFDIFCFPSNFEGLPVVAVEAQANGLTVIASLEGMPQKTKILDSFCFLSFEKSADEWAEKILKVQKNRENIRVIRNKFREKRFDIEYEAKIIENDFLKKIN